MYSNILYFIIVLLIYSGYTQPESVSFPWDVDAAGIAVLGILFYLYVRNRFEYFSRRCSRDYARLSACASYHAALVGRITILGVVIYALFIYVFDLKGLLAHVQLIRQSAFLSNLLGVAPFLALLLIIWSCAFPSYHQFCNAGVEKPEYIESHLKINCTVLIPWLLVSFGMDAVNFVCADVFKVLDDYPLASLFLTVALLMLLSIYLPFVIVRLWDCKPLPQGPLRGRLERFCKSSGFACADIMLWNLFAGRLITAGVIGFTSRFRYILISPSLIELLDDQELEAVVAHEIGHVKHRHMLYYVLIIMGFALCAYEMLELLSYRILSLDAVTTLIAAGTAFAGSVVSIAMTALPILCFILYYRFFFGYCSRNFERQADVHALKMTRTSSGIIQSLEKIARAGSLQRSAPNWHHFSIAERIHFLERCDRDPSLIQKHDRKVASLLSAYMFLFIATSSLFYYYGERPLMQARMIFMQKVLEKQVAANPGNELYAFSLGNVYFEEGNLKNAEAYFKKALALNPGNPEILNNLAWLYATSADKELYRPQEALKLSLQAANLSSKPHIFDTLGQSYFINGRYEEAVKALEQALAARPENRTYYEKQLDKFKKCREEERKQEFNNEAIDAGAQAI